MDLTGLTIMCDAVKGFDPSEARDNSGKWTAGGASSPKAERWRREKNDGRWTVLPSPCTKA